MLIKNYIFWPKNAKTGNITLGEILIRKNWCGRFWWFWIFNSTFWLAWQAIIFSTSMLFRLSFAFSVLISINKQILHMNAKYKIFLHENGDHLAFSKNMNHDVLCSKQRKCQKSLNLEKHDFTLKVFLHAHLWMQITVKHIFRHKNQKALVKTLLWVTLKYDHNKKKKYFYCKHNRFRF